MQDHRRRPRLLRSKGRIGCTLRNISERELVRRCITCDNGAWLELIRRHGAVIYATIVRQLACSMPSRDGHEAEDILGKVFEKLLERDCRVLRNLRDLRALRAYLCQIARTVTVDHLRSELTVRPVTSSHELGLTSTEPSGIAVANEQYEILEETLQKLPYHHRLFLKLHYEEGLAYKEIAELTATPIGTVSSALHRARKSARGLLEKREVSVSGRANP